VSAGGSQIRALAACRECCNDDGGSPRGPGGLQGNVAAMMGQPNQSPGSPQGMLQHGLDILIVPAFVVGKGPQWHCTVPPCSAVPGAGAHG